MSRLSTLRNWLAARLATVTAIEPGKTGDGITSPLYGNAIEKSWGEQIEVLQDALEAWRVNPLARRMLGMITAYTVGDGIRISSEYAPLDRFIKQFWNHPSNNIDLELPEWSDELARSGELFFALFTNPGDGMTYVRAVPAQHISEIEWKDGDYKTELRYRDISTPEEVWWPSQNHPSAEDPNTPIMLHFAVNRPVGALRGESDLAPILPWLRRYSRWLEDRVRLNAAMRAFLWIVNAPSRIHERLRQQYSAPPEPGTLILADENETWTAVAPNLHAQDAEKDGRAIRWMIAAGGPGTALIDLAEGEDSNQAVGTTMQEQKRRFLRRRQRYLIHILQSLITIANERASSARTRPQRQISHDDFIAHVPDISPEDNEALASAAAQITSSLQQLAGMIGDSQAMRRMALRLFTKFAGEQITSDEFDEIINTGVVKTKDENTTDTDAEKSTPEKTG